MEQKKIFVTPPKIDVVEQINLYYHSKFDRIIEEKNQKEWALENSINKLRSSYSLLVLRLKMLKFIVGKLRTIAESTKYVGKKQGLHYQATGHAVIKCGEVEYIRHAVKDDGNCGYTAFGIERMEAYRLLCDNINNIRDILIPIIEETLFTNEDFVNSLIEGFDGLKRDSLYYYAALRRKDPELLIFEHALRVHAQNLNLIDAYIDYDVKSKQIDYGWCHPLILYALAHISGVDLRLYVIVENQKMDPHPHFPGYHPKDAQDGVELLFINGNHFERLALRQEISSMKKASLIAQETVTLIPGKSGVISGDSQAISYLDFNEQLRLGINAIRQRYLVKYSESFNDKDTVPTDSGYVKLDDECVSRLKAEREVQVQSISDEYTLCVSQGMDIKAEINRLAADIIYFIGNRPTNPSFQR